MHTLDILIPAHNEAQILAESLRRLLVVVEQLPVTWNITVLDSASTDDTATIAEATAKTNSRIRCLRVPVLGKGAALRAGILASTADIIAYMDADLSADIAALPEFLERLLHQHIDMVIGSRLLQPAQVRRRWARTATSRLFNMATRTFLGVSVHDSQCGFKIFFRAPLLPLVRQITEEGWFFDTELLVYAQHAGVRLEERPLAWEEQLFAGRKSKLHLFSDALRVVPMIMRLRKKRKMLQQPPHG
jgi:glycosyltransferase involved in cell wall biosynthesis